MKKIFSLVFALSLIMVSNFLFFDKIVLASTISAFHISQQNNGLFQEIYSQSFQTKYSTRTFDFKNLSQSLTLKISEYGDLPYSGMDSAVLNACGTKLVPTSAFYTDNNQSILADILSTDLNIVVTHEKPIQISWNLPEGCTTATLSVNANEYGEGLPFHFPSTGTAEYQLGSNSGSLNIDGKISEIDGTSALYTPYWYPSSGHPNGSVYVYTKDDSNYLYFATDLTIDNTNDIGPDWISVNIGDRKFKVTDADDTYGKCSFGLTSKVSYKHQTCELKIPKNEINYTNSVPFTLEYYGTASGPNILFKSPSTPEDGATTTATSVNISTDTTSIAGQHYVLNDFDNSLVGWWRGEGTANEDSSFNNDGVLVGDATTTAGKFGQAFSFDGTGDYVSVSSANEFNMAPSNALTISTWVKSDSASVGNNCLIPTKRIIGYADVSGAFDLDWDHCGLGGTSFSIYNGASYFAATTLLNASEWYHLVGVYNGTSVKLYVDGVLVNEAATTGTINSASGFLTIGSDTAGTSNFSGLVDDTSLWNRALSASEVKSLYNANAYNYIDQDISLVGWWRGDGHVYDDSGKGNIGVNHGATYSTGKLFTALSFKGTGSDYVEIPNQAYFSADDGALAISFWAMVPTDAPSVSNGIAGDAGAYMVTKTGGGGYEWGIENDGNTQICFDYWNAGNTYNCTNFTVNDGLYHHYLAMFDDVNGNFSFYIDGVNKWNGSNNGGASALNVPILIGTRTEKDSQHSFTGSIDDLMIFDKILSNTEIQALYNQYDNSYVSDFTNLATGEHTMTVSAVDLVGNKVSTGQRTFIVEGSPVELLFANSGEEGIDGLSSSTAYRIDTCQQLQNIGASDGVYLNKYFILNRNIDCSGIPNFVPIGNLSTTFSGSFDGANFDISNLTINRPEEDQVGLFGVVSDGGTTLISNVNLKNINIIGNKRVGGLVGYVAGNVTISNSSGNGSVSGVSKVGGLIGSGLQFWLNGLHNNSTVSANYTGPTSQNGVGGIVGVADSVLMENSYNTGNVNAVGTLYTGGLIGSSNSMAITKSYNTGDVTGNSSTHTVGGLAGASTGSNFMRPMIWNSYNTGNVSGSRRVGGLIGFTPVVEIYDSYNAGSVTATYLVGASDVGGDGAGGLVGINSLEGLSGQFPGTGNIMNIHNSFNVGAVSASKNIGGLIGFVGAIDADHITWQGNGWDRPAKTISTTNNFYYKPSGSSLNCNDQFEISECTVKNNTGYFKNTASVAPFISTTENPDLIYWKWNFTGETEGQPEPVWYVQSNDYPKFTAQTIFPDPTCSDGILNQNETSIDVGGVCSPAPTAYSGSSGGSSVVSQYNNLIAMGNIRLANELVSQYPNLFVSTSFPTSTSTKVSILNRNLAIGSTGDDVKKLQQLLNSKGYIVSKIGPGSPGKETNKFGAATKKALINFQIKNKILPATGNLGPRTRAVIEK